MEEQVNIPALPKNVMGRRFTKFLAYFGYVRRASEGGL